MLKAPFPYFGGKASVARDVWAALGQPKHYIEPFFGSGAVLLLRPKYKSIMIETVNDKDGLLCNVWRSLQFAPDETAKWCDWPVNHADLCARRRVLIANQDRLLSELIANDSFCDPKLAGYWIWAASSWIGSGLTRLNAMPHVSDGGMGVHSIGQRPHVSHGGMLTDPHNTNIYAWFRELSERLRYVRVVCGDWKQVCGGTWQNVMGICGIFFDPPYGEAAGRHPGLYAKDSLTVAQEVQDWALERGKKITYRIVLAGYFEEHEDLLSHGWTVKKWKTDGGYAKTSRNGATDNPGKANRQKEALFFSPHCLKGSLFDL